MSAATAAIAAPVISSRWLYRPWDGSQLAGPWRVTALTVDDAGVAVELVHEDIAGDEHGRITRSVRTWRATSWTQLA